MSAACLRPAAAERGARAARQGRDRRGRAQGGRGPRDRARHQKQEEVGLQCDHRRRIPPLLVASRFPLGPRRRREARHGAAASPSPACNTRNEGVKVTGKIGFSGHPMIEHFKFVAAHTKRTPKITIPAPSAALRPAGRDADRQARSIRSSTSSSTISAQAYSKAVRAFADAGCRYLQLDEVFIAMLCDPKYRAADAARGDDPEKLGELYGDLINTAMSDIPADMTITMHLCRGNYKSTYHGRGRLRRRCRRSCSTDQGARLLHGIRQRRAPAASSRCGCCRRARRWCSAS